MSIEEWLKPRYKVIADYPDSPYKTNQILSFTEGITILGYTINYAEYPHLFKELQWWEERDPEVMPDYVKYETGKIVKVKQWQFDGDTEVENTLFFTTDDDELGFYPNKYLPATESDYLTYKSISTQK